MTYTKQVWFANGIPSLWNGKIYSSIYKILFLFSLEKTGSSISDDALNVIFNKDLAKKESKRSKLTDNFICKQLLW